MENFKNGGGIPERYRNMGFSKVGQKKKSTRPGKKWMVLAKKGDDYKVVHGGYKGMQDYTQHGSESRRDNFWNRMGGKSSAKAKDPFSPLYWHKRLGTWETGGQLPQFTMGGPGDPTKPVGMVDPNDPYARFKYGAKLYYYKQLLNDKLRGKDPDSYDNFFKGRAEAYKNLGWKNIDKYDQDANYNVFLTPDEIKSTLGNNYMDYVDALSGVTRLDKSITGFNKGPVIGTKENPETLHDIKYGRRFATMMMTPGIQSNIKGDSRYYTYDPLKGFNETIYRDGGQPCFNCGGNVPMFQDGGSFGKAFADARREGLKIFTWRGKQYTTKLKSEEDAENTTAPRRTTPVKTVSVVQPAVKKSKNLPVNTPKPVPAYYDPTKISPFNEKLVKKAAVPKKIVTDREVVIDKRNAFEKFFNIEDSNDIIRFNLPEDVYRQYQTQARANSGKKFGIVSKKNARAYFFNPDGSLAIQDEVGLGKDRSERQNVYYQVQTTPSGTYKMEHLKNRAAGYDSKNFFYIDNIDPNKRAKDPADRKVGARQAIHGIPYHLKAERLPAFDNNNVSDNFMSAGCINCKREFLDNPYFDDLSEGNLYVLPERKWGGLSYFNNGGVIEKYTEGGKPKIPKPLNGGLTEYQSRPGTVNFIDSYYPNTFATYNTSTGLIENPLGQVSIDDMYFLDESNKADNRYPMAAVNQTSKKPESMGTTPTKLDPNYAMMAPMAVGFLSGIANTLAQNNEKNERRKRIYTTDSVYNTIYNVGSRGRDANGRFAPTYMTSIQFPGNIYDSYPKYGYQDGGGIDLKGAVLGLPEMVFDPNEYNQLEVRFPEPEINAPIAEQPESATSSVRSTKSNQVDADLFLPLDSNVFKLTSGFGKRKSPKSGASTDHNGVDLAVPEGSNIYSIKPGVVIKKFSNNKGGNQLIVRHDDGTTSGYAHLKDFVVNEGDQVGAGALIGYSGNTGNSTGPHLHFTYKDVNGRHLDPTTLFDFDMYSSKGKRSSKTNGEMSYTHNNPLNVHYGKFAKQYGGVKGSPDAGGNVSIFPDMQTGITAAADLLFSPNGSYSNLTVSEARNRWVNGKTSIPSNSTKDIVKMMGGDKRLSQLNPKERELLFKQFAKWEGKQAFNQIKNLDLTSVFDKYLEGGEYELSDAEIKQILANGGSVEYL